MPEIAICSMAAAKATPLLFCIKPSIVAPTMQPSLICNIIAELRVDAGGEAC